MEKFVVISSKPMPHSGSRVLCAAVSKEEVEKTLLRVQATPHLVDLGPFRIFPADEAEKQGLYGD